MIASFDKTITAKKKWYEIDFHRIYEYKDLIGILVRRDFVTYYKQTVLGPLWHLFQPIVNAITYMIIFGTLANMGTDGVPQVLFYFSGTILWTFFSENLTAVSNTFTTNKDLFGKIYFPRLVMPLVSTLGHLIKLLLQLALFLIMYVSYLIMGAEINVSWRIALAPLVILWISLLSIGLGMIVASVTTKYRDIAMALSFFLGLSMYITPVAYPLSTVQGKLRILFFINPMTAPIELFRYCWFNTQISSMGLIISSLATTLIAFLWGLVIFSRNERTFVDMI